ncbi:DUF6194 family protein [Streptomyces sp. NPDC059524]|uniref:DUF6194 family protein n=1 Tax=Streptomyces sp. NPDC059524 TaxID=3346856 RepID=UPI0036A9657A
MDRIIAEVRAFDGAHVQLPAPGDGTPEIAWGDAFFFYAPDGRPPAHAQPYATIVTKNYPGDAASDLDTPDRWRLNIQVGRTSAVPDLPTTADHSTVDVVQPHPVYGAQGWVCVVNPGERTTSTALTLLRDAHEAARGRYERRRTPGA